MRVVWIEILTGLPILLTGLVTTLRVVWIEIEIAETFGIISRSPPCGWCGLKSLIFNIRSNSDYVTTLRVVWIEIPPCNHIQWIIIVTTLRVVWIEMVMTLWLLIIQTGHHLAGGVD